MRKKTKTAKARTDTSFKKRKTAKKKRNAAKRMKAAKTRNNGTMTEQAFWNMIRQLLRRRTIYWLPIVEVRNRNRVAYKGPNKRRKFSYICENCKGEFAGTEVAVHHKIEAGSLTCAADAGGFINRLFCEKEDLKLLCNGCHNMEHQK